MVYGDVSRAILEMIKTMSVKEIAAARGTSVQNVHNLLKRMERKGLVVSMGKGAWVTPYVKDTQPTAVPEPSTEV